MLACAKEPHVFAGKLAGESYDCLITPRLGGTSSAGSSGCKSLMRMVLHSIAAECEALPSVQVTTPVAGGGIASQRAAGLGSWRLLAPGLRPVGPS